MSTQGRTSASCIICMHKFAAADRRPVALPCAHTFCLGCLVHLKASASPTCPQCRQSFETVQLPELSKMARVSSEKTLWDKSGKSGEDSKQTELVGCKEHEEPFVYWSTISNELYCTTCILSVDIKTSCLKRVSEALPLIRDDLEKKAGVVRKGLKSDSANHKEERKMAVHELKKIYTFEKHILALKAEYQEFIAKVDSHNFKLHKQSTFVKEIKKKIPEIESEKDIKFVLNYKDALEELRKTTFGCQQQNETQRRIRRQLAIGYGAPSFALENQGSSNQVQQLKRPAKLLADIACAFEEGEQQATFIQKLQQKTQGRNNNRAAYGSHHSSFHTRHDPYYGLDRVLSESEDSDVSDWDGTVVH